MHLKLSYNWYRFMGITTICLLGYIVVIGIFGNTDITPLLPTETARSLQARWPDMPFFKTAHQTIDNGTQTETYFLVPTRQLTAKEIAALKASGHSPQPPAKAKEPTPPQ